MVIAISCNKESFNADLDCTAFQEGLFKLDDAVVGDQLNLLTEALTPQPAAGDPLGHAANIETLISRFRGQCNGFQVEFRCYTCIYTLPPQSELAFTLGSAGIAIERIVDLFTPGNDVPTFVHRH